jgi:putative DNA primase/helicase
MNRDEEYYDGLRKEFDRAHAESSGNGADSLPEIRVEPGKLPELAEQGEKALIKTRCTIYRRDTVLVRPTVEEVDAAGGRKTNVARLIDVSVPYLRGELCKVAHWKRYNLRQRNWTPTNPPDNVVQLILANYGNWNLPAVAGVITTPTIRPDGTILSAEGYDPATRLYLMSPPELSLPSSPSKEDAQDALKLLDGLFYEFPFVDEPSRSVALSATLTTVARGAFPVTPMHAASSPMAGSGKSYLWDTVAVVATGQWCPVMTAGPSPEETEKRLGSALMRGQALISIDNVNGELSGDALCQCIERPRIQVRILGRSQLFDIDARATTVLATGNNLTLTGDVVRRSLRCLLDPQVERPEERKFSGSPVDVIMANRSKYIAAALTIVRAYILAGRPNVAARLASFEAWSDTVRSPLIWLGRDDSVKTIDRSRQDDPKLVLLRQMLCAWRDELGVDKVNRYKASDIIKMVEPPENGGECQRPALKAPVTDAGAYRGRVSARSLSNWLNRNKGIIANGLRLAAESDVRGYWWWWVEEAGSTLRAHNTPCDSST